MARLAWITGAGGLIGSNLVRVAPQCAPGWEVRALTRAELDLRDRDEVARAFESDRPELIVHCAAMSRSPACQADPNSARAINVDVTAHLAELAERVGFIFFSSDLVFNGQTGNYDESAAPAPLGVYAETKLAAERCVLANPKHTVVRTSLNGGCSPTGDRGFNEQLRAAWQRGNKPKLFTDEFRSPIEASWTARAVWALANQQLPGIFHVAGTERLSRFEIGQLLAQRWPQLNPQFEPASARDYPGPPRAPDTSLNCKKISTLLSFRLPGFSEWLRGNPEVRF